MKILFYFLFFLGCTHTPTPVSTSIILEWQGSQDKTVPVLIFTDDKSYINSFGYSKFFSLDNDQIINFRKDLPYTSNSKTDSSLLKITLKEGVKSYHFFYNQKELVILLNKFISTCDKIHLISAKIELTYFQNLAL